jgi:NADPH:quinone reductase-like Zn-dependent oxidoreductase
METMKAVRIHSFGGPQALKLEELPRPQPAEDEILVQVKATSVNPIDYKVRSGQYAKPEQLPITPGRDVAGTVALCGTQVSDWHPGDDVFALLPPGRGAYAEYVTIKASQSVAKPRQLDYEHAAAVPLAALTAWQGLFDHGQLKAGQRVLIHGAAGGVGHFAVQLAKVVGAEVFATASSSDVQFLQQLGADHVIDYRSERFEAAVADVDLVLDLIGGETQERSWAVLKEGGTLVSTLDEPSQEKAREHNARGTSFLTQPNAAELAQIARLIDEGKVRPLVEKCYPLEEAATAQEQLERKHARGKTVIQVERGRDRSGSAAH